VCCVAFRRSMGHGKHMTHRDPKESKPMTKAEMAKELGIGRKTLFRYRQNPTFPAKGSVAEMRHWMDTHAGTVTAPRSGTPRTQPPTPADSDLFDGNWHARYTRARALEKEAKLGEAETGWIKTAREQMHEEIGLVLDTLNKSIASIALPRGMLAKAHAAIKESGIRNTTEYRPK